jgi:NAD(P)H-dependent FMN reductase
MEHDEDNLKIGIVLGSTRPGRQGPAIGAWVLRQAKSREHAEFEIVDLADHALPLLDEPVPAIVGDYRQPHTKDWARRIAAFDGFVFVTPEYNRSLPAALKNAIDFLYAEWNNKAAGIVSYGGDASGARAAEHLRQVLGEVQVADVRATVALSGYTDFDDARVFTPLPHRAGQLDLLLDALLAWAGALRTMRRASSR